MDYHDLASEVWEFRSVAQMEAAKCRILGDSILLGGLQAGSFLFVQFSNQRGNEAKSYSLAFVHSSDITEDVVAEVAELVRQGGGEEIKDQAIKKARGYYGMLEFFAFLKDHTTDQLYDVYVQ